MTSSSDATAPATNAATAGTGPGAGPGSTARAEFGVTGMHCSACVALIEEALTDRAGVRSASVDLDAGRATVGYDPSLLDVDELRSTIEEAGYSATPVG